VGHNFGQQLLQGCLSKSMADSRVKTAGWRIQVILQLEPTLSYPPIFRLCGHPRLKLQYSPTCGWH